MARKKMQEPERWITVNGQHLPVYPGGVIGQPGQTPPAKESKSKTPAVNDKGTMSPKKLSDAEDRRDQLWDKEDKGTITPAEKKELDKLEKSISGHYTEKKNQMAGKKSSADEMMEKYGWARKEGDHSITYKPEGITPAFHGGESYNYMVKSPTSNGKGTTTKYFKTEEEANNYVRSSKSSGFEYRSGMTKEERRQFLDDAPEGTRITGLIDKRTGNELIVEKQGGYSQVYGGVGAGSKHYESYWTIAGEKNPYIAKNLREAEEGTSPYYEFRKSSASKPATSTVSDRERKVADQARKSLNFDKGYAEITANHWNYAKMSNDKVVKALNATDDKYSYELRQEQTKGAFMSPNAVVNHTRLYRTEKKPATTSRNARYDTSRVSYVQKSVASLKTMYKNATPEDKKRIAAEMNARGYYYRDGKWVSHK